MGVSGHFDTPGFRLADVRGQLTSPKPTSSPVILIEPWLTLPRTRFGLIWLSQRFAVSRELGVGCFVLEHRPLLLNDVLYQFEITY
jgi:hypothetical protein